MELMIVVKFVLAFVFGGLFSFASGVKCGLEWLLAPGLHIL